MAPLSLEKIEAFMAIGYGSGYGDGSGYGNGSGYGSGYGDGSGYGYGDGYGITTFCGDAVRRVDGIYTVLHAIHGNAAKASILGGDFTLSPCYVVKGGGCFAHGETIQQAQEALEVKLFSRMPVEEKIEEFLKAFDLSKKHPVKSFYDWHNRLTGSCEMGRKAFAKEHGIDIEKDEMTVDAFIKLTRNAFGGSVIRQLEERIGEHAKHH